MANPTSKINLVIDGTTTQLDIHDADAVPRTGGAVMTGSSLGRTVNNSELKINGGTSESNGSAILLRGKDKTGNGGETDIVANDGTDSTTVNIKPNGTITRVTNNVTKNFAMQEDVNTLLSGKANSSHTHTKSEITDFPSFGTTSGTICEGNDSRLSDARTPIAHTHTASDISSGLASVATSGSYNDLSDKPTIPTYSAGTNLSLNDTTFNVSSTPSFTSITVSGYTITID